MDPETDPDDAAVIIEAVEWLPSGGGSGLVRVRGRRTSGEPVVLPALVAEATDGERLRHASLPDPRAGREPGVWRGAYIVRTELVDAGRPLLLELAEGGDVVLPAPSRGLTALAASPAHAPPVPAHLTDRSEGGEVIDRAVMAERRARRAEAAVQAQARIAGEALKAVEVLELRGAELERRLSELIVERDELSGGESVVVLRERLAAAEGRALELRHEASAARQAGEAEADRVAGLLEAAEARVAEQDGRLRSALNAAGGLRDLVRDGAVRMRSAEVARTSDAVRLAVLEAGRTDADVARAAAQVALTEADAALKAAGTELQAYVEALRAARADAGQARDETRAVQAQLDELERAGARREGETVARDAERSVLATTLVELDEYRLAAETELHARAQVAAELEAERVTVVELAAELEAQRQASAATDVALATETEARQVAERLSAAETTARQVAEQRAKDAAELVARLADAEEAARRMEAERTAAEERALALEAERDAARDDVEALRMLAQAAEQTRSAFEAELIDLRAQGSAGSLTDRVADLERAPAARPEAIAERAASLVAPTPSAPSPLVADLDRAAAALRARRPQEPQVTVARPVGPPARGDATGTSRREYPWLRGALVKLAHDDPATAARLLVGLLPAQAELLEAGTALDYDLTLPELGTFAVTVAGGAATVAPLERPRSRRRADFRLAGSSLALAELLAGHGRRPRRLTGPVRLSGRRRGRAGALLSIPQAVPSLTQAARAGARLEPGDVFAAFPYAIHPSWTLGHAFTVTQEVLEHGSWVVTVADGAALTVEPGPAPNAPRAEAAVTFTRGAFDALLRRESPPAGERPRVRGDRAMVALLKGWTDRALGDPPPDPPPA